MSINTGPQEVTENENINLQNLYKAPEFDSRKAYLIDS
jgi:hypothetical protein